VGYDHQIAKHLEELVSIIKEYFIPNKKEEAILELLITIDILASQRKTSVIRKLIADYRKNL
jgi:hypothetical protein